MVIKMKFNSVAELAELQRIAVAGDKPVYIASEDDSIRVDARSFIGMFAMDYAKPVNVVTDSLYVIRRLESGLRKRDLSAVR